MRISDKVIGEIVRQVSDHLTAYQGELSDAFVHSGDSLGVGFSVRVRPAKDGRMEIETGIAFVKERVADKISALIDDTQAGLFEDEE